jgi:hypothetical protein
MVFSLVNQRSSYNSFSSLQRKLTPRTASGNPQVIPANRGPELVRNLLSSITQMPLFRVRQTRGDFFPTRTMEALLPVDI